MNHLENTTKTDTADEKFLSAKCILDDVRKYEDEIHVDTQTESTKTKQFTHNDEHSNIDRLNDLTLVQRGMDVETDIRDDDSILDTETPSDTERSFITAMGILSDGRKLLLDVENTKVKLFSAINIFLGEIALPDKACAMVVLNDNEAVVVLPEREDQALQKVNISGNALTLGSCIPTTLQHLLISKYSDTSLLTLAYDESGQELCMQIINHNGNIEKSTKLDSELLTRPAFIATGVDRTMDLVYILDVENCCFGFTLDGKTVFHHKEDKYDAHIGMVVDEEGSIYIGCGKEGNIALGNIVKLSPVGKKMKRMFDDDRKMGLIPLKCAGNKMFVFTIDEHDTVCVRHILT